MSEVYRNGSCRVSLIVWGPSRAVFVVARDWYCDGDARFDAWTTQPGLLTRAWLRLRGRPWSVLGAAAAAIEECDRQAERVEGENQLEQDARNAVAAVSELAADAS